MLSAVRSQGSDGFYGYDGCFRFIQTLIPVSFLSEMDVSHCTLFSRCAYTPSSGVSDFTFYSF